MHVAIDDCPASLFIGTGWAPCVCLTQLWLVLAVDHALAAGEGNLPAAFVRQDEKLLGRRKLGGPNKCERNYGM